MGRPLTEAPADEFLAGVFTSDAGERPYKLFRPSAARLPVAGQRMLLVMLHGCTQQGDDVAKGTRFNEAAARDGFLVLYPEQSLAAHPLRCWRWYEPDQITRGRGEASIIAQLTAKVTRDEGVDARRVFVAGMSAGAGMAASLAAGYPEQFAAAALHSGVPAFFATDATSALVLMRKGPPDGDALGAAAYQAMGARARVVPVISVHGAADPVVSVLNLAAVSRQWAVANALASGVETPHASAVPSDDARLTGQRFALATGEVLAESWRIAGLGHAWSGGSTAGSYTDPAAPDASTMMLGFFRNTLRRG